MVASKRGDGLATHDIPVRSTPALPVTKNINGVLIETSSQNQFNDHRNI